MSSNGNGSDWRKVLLSMLPDVIRQFPLVLPLLIIIMVLLYQNQQLFDRCLMLPLP
jgi:hypothetical protein